MATPLTPTGTLTYNGFDLNNAHTEIVSFTQRPMRDNADRTDVYYVYTLGIATVLQSTPATTIDTQMDNARKQLGRSGGALVASGIGLGTFTVNSGSVKDVRWGPKIVDLQFFPQNPYFARLVWTVQIALPECTSGTPVYAGDIIAFNYEPTWVIDEDGYTTVTHTGYIEIPMSRPSISSRNLPDHVDQYRDRIPVQRIAGFSRVSQTYHASADGRVLNFTLVDREMSTVPHAGAVRWKLMHSCRPTGGSVFRFTFALSLRVRMAKGYTFGHAFAIWEQVFREYTRDGDRPVHFSIDTEKGDDTPTITFNYGFDYFPPTALKDKLGKPEGFNLKTMLEQTRLLELPKQQPWDKWRDATNDTQNERGRAGLVRQKNDDLIVDACSGLSGEIVARAAADQAKKTAAKKFDLNGSSKLTGDARFGECTLLCLVVTASRPTFHVSSVPASSSAFTPGTGINPVQGGTASTMPSNELWHLKVIYHFERFGNTPVLPVAERFGGNSLEMFAFRPKPFDPEVTAAGLKRYTIGGEVWYRIKNWNSKMGDDLKDFTDWKVSFRANGAFPLSWVGEGQSLELTIGQPAGPQG